MKHIPDRNEYKYPLAEYGFRRTASVLALSVRRKENNGIIAVLWQ